MPAHIDQIVFTVNSFTGQTFAEVQNAFCRLVDETNGGGRQLKAIGEAATGRTFQDLLPSITPHL